MSQQHPEHHTPQYLNNGSGTRANDPRGGRPVGQPTARPIYVSVKSMLVSYILWFFLGQIGAHKFYLRAPLLGIFYILLAATGYALAGIGIGFFFLIPLWFLLFIDIFTIPFRVGILNARANAMMR